MDNKGYYKILGVSENASQDEIKSAYRNLCLKWHPDKWVSSSESEKKNAEEKFKEIAEAYDVLGNADKRKQYDMGGSVNFDSGFDPFSVFRQHFGGGSPFGFNFGGGQTQNVGTDVNVTVNVTLSEAYSGTMKEVEVTKEHECEHCHGTGSENGRQTTCPDCGGSGMKKVVSSQRGNMFFQSLSPCPRCNGTGHINSNPCRHCNGTGTTKKKQKELISVPPGVDSGMKMRLDGRGNAAVGGGINGDLIVTFNVSDDNYFKRVDQLNIVHYEEVPFVDAMLGKEMEFKCLDGSKVKIKIPELTKDNQAFFQKGKGMPNVNNPYQKGDYAVVIKYKYPNKLTKKQKELLKQFSE